MTKRAVKTRVDAALAMLFARDGFLLEHRVGERAVVAKLASYLTLSFRDYDVDVEYNRQGLDPTDTKELILGPECRGRRRKARRVYPDIIVHRRGVVRGSNLLVAEIKRSSNTEPRTCDRAKIDAMKTKYGYRFGLLIEVPSGKGARSKQPSLAWR
jgi:hypothetical protein